MVTTSGVCIIMMTGQKVGGPQTTATLTMPSPRHAPYRPPLNGMTPEDSDLIHVETNSALCAAGTPRRNRVNPPDRGEATRDTMQRHSLWSTPPLRGPRRSRASLDWICLLCLPLITPRPNSTTTTRLSLPKGTPLNPVEILEEPSPSQAQVYYSKQVPLSTPAYRCCCGRGTSCGRSPLMDAACPSDDSS